MKRLSRALAALGLALAAGPALADDGWRSTPWPSQSKAGVQFCFIGYENAGQSFNVMIREGGLASMAITDPAFANPPEGAALGFTFPSGWSGTVPHHPTGTGVMVGIDLASFHRILDELATPGALAFSLGTARVEIPVPDRLAGRIRTLRGPLPPDALLASSCVEQLPGG